MKKLLAIISLASAVGSAFAITGADATHIIDVSEEITFETTSSSLYTFTFTNLSASAPIWLFGVYTDTPVNSISAANGTLGSEYTSNTDPHGGYGESGYTALDSIVGTYNPNDLGSPDVTVGNSGTLSFIANSGDTGPTVFFAEVEHQSDGIGSDGTIQFSYKGSVTPDSTPEPVLTAAIGLAGLGSAFARRRRSA